VQEECIPAEKELDTKPLDDVLGKLRIEARAKGCGARSCEGIWRHGLGSARQRAGAEELGESILGALSMNTQGPTMPRC